MTAVIPPDLLPHRITRVRPATTTDAWNATDRDYGVAATRTADIPARIQQDTRAEVYLDARTPTEQRWALFTNETDWDRHDQVEWIGPDGLLTFDMFGEAEPAYDRGSLHHLEATLRLVDG